MKVHIYRIPLRTATVLGFAILVSTGPFANSGFAADPTEKPIETRIVSATVYGDRAQLVRSARVDVKPGLYRLICDDLPKGFSESSLQVDGEGTARAAIIGIEIIERPGIASETPRYTELEKRLEALKASRDSLKIRRQALGKRQEFLTRLGEYPFQKSTENQTAEVFRVGDWQNLLDYLENERITVASRDLDLDRLLTDFDKKIGWLNAELNSLRTQGKWGKRVVIECDVVTAGTLDLDLLYIAPNASWRPQYTVRYLAAQGQVELTYNATIKQVTGEDWQDVSVVLSTARPHVGAAPPKIGPYYLNFIGTTLNEEDMEMSDSSFQKYAIDSVEEALGKTGGVVMRAGEAYARGGRTAETRFRIEQSHLQGLSSDFATNLAIAMPVDLASGADPRRVMVLRQKLAGDLERTAAPRLSPNVFIKGAFENSLDVPILGGGAEVYIETVQPDGKGRASNFVGRESVESAASGEKFDLYLGIDQDVKITHERLKKERLSKLDSKRARIRYSYLITLENFKSESCQVTLRDRIPVSRIKDIKVDDVEFDPEPAEQKPDGIITWKLDLLPQVKQEVRIQYVIVYPGDWAEHMLNLE